MTQQTDILNDDKYRPIHNKGFIGLVNHMGSDSEIIRIARISYQKGTKQVSDDTTLIRYLMRNWHVSPFEMGEITLHVKCPIFVARQWHRHRSANYDELSARYSFIENDFYIPETVGRQSSDNKQGTGEPFSEEQQKEFKEFIEDIYINAYGTYKHLYENEVSKELARMILPQGIYTEFFCKMNIRNLFNFLRLRMDEHAQKEIRDYADAIYDMVKPLFPKTFEAFDDYVIHSKSFSRMEMNALNVVLFNNITPEQKDQIEELLFADGCTKREVKEFFEKVNV
jgi:thymidylate synthase (FAD)